jgi:hypothetical protein
MSTKTTFKRIALVAVAALGFGMLSVAPSSAAPAAATASAVAPLTTAATIAGPLGTVTFGGITSGSEADTFAVRVLTGPAGGVLTITQIGAADTTDTTHTVGASAAADHTEAAGTANANGALAVLGSFSLPGTYTVAWGAVTTITGTYTVTGLKNSIAPLVGDGLSLAYGNATNGSTLNAIAGSFNTVTLGVASGTGVQVAGGNTLGTSAARTLVSVSGAGATITSQTSMTVATGGLTAVSNVSNLTFSGTRGEVVINTPTAGTIIVSSFLETGAGSGIFSATADRTITVTVNAVASSGVHTAANSLAYMGAVAALQTVTGTDDVILANNSSTATAQAANITVTVRDSALATINNLAVSAVITGPGLLGITDTAETRTTAGTLRVAALGAAGTTGEFNVTVWPDKTGVGTATSTVTISAGTTVIAIKTIKWYGAVASYVLTTKNKALSVGSTADAQVLTVAALDANGVAIPNATVNVSSSSTTTATVDTATVATAADGAAADIGVNGVAKGDAVITVGNASSSPTVSATATISVVTSGIASVTLSYDKATYAPGEKATVAITAKNSDGVLSGDQDYANLFATGGITSSSSFTTVMSAVDRVLTNGVFTHTVFMPLTAGPVTISATLGASVAAAIQATTVTATVTVVADTAALDAADAAADAAAEATDAANAATDAANAAAEAADAATAAAQDSADAVAALATQVATYISNLRKQITALTNLVIKIQKKVKA